MEPRISLQKVFQSGLGHLVKGKLTLDIPGFQKEEGGEERERKVMAPPGMESREDIHQAPEPGTVRITCMDYSMDRLEVQVFADVDMFLAAEKPEWSKARWVNVDGLHGYVVHRLKAHYGFHTLSGEDVLQVPQRPKLDCYENYLFLIARMILDEGDSLRIEQLSLFLLPGVVLTFQENLRQDCWAPLRKRLESPQSRLRRLGAPYLLYALLDGVVDRVFPVLDHYGEVLEALEEECLQHPDADTQRKIYAARREMMQIRQVLLPMREVIRQLLHDEENLLPDELENFYRDLYDHSVELLDLIESYRETTAGLQELFMASVSHRITEVMKVLTILASFFIPLTFLAGVYGMNFDYLPELRWKWSYPVFWAVCLGVSLGLLVFFKRKRWL